MAVYVIIIREGPVRDEEAMQEYMRILGANEVDPKLKMHAFYGEQHVLEGEAPHGVVLLEFPTVEDAKAWYEGPVYREAAPYRIKAADYRAVIVQGC